MAHYNWKLTEKRKKNQSSICDDNRDVWKFQSWNMSQTFTDCTFNQVAQLCRIQSLKHFIFFFLFLSLSFHIEFNFYSRKVYFCWMKKDHRDVQLELQKCKSLEIDWINLYFPQARNLYWSWPLIIHMLMKFN